MFLDLYVGANKRDMREMRYLHTSPNIRLEASC
jgi:hypothetical protein